MENQLDYDLNENSLLKKEEITTKEDFFESMEHEGYHMVAFESLKSFPKNETKMKDFMDNQEKVIFFMKEAIKNLYNKIEGKKYNPKYNYKRIIINSIIIFLLIIVHFSNSIKGLDIKLGNNKKEKIYAKFSIVNNNVLNIESGNFNFIDLDLEKRQSIKSIVIEKGSKIIGDCSYLFQGFSNCKSIQIENLDTSEAINMSYMFSNNYNLKYLNLKNFDTSKTQDMSYMFYYNEKLKELKLFNFNTKNVKFMTSMFDSCESIKNLNLSSFNTQNVLKMDAMFANCFSLEEINLSNFNGKSVETTKSMFFNCSALKEINLSNFNGKNVKDTSFMFSDCSSLKKLNINNFDTSNVENMRQMFYYSSSIISLDLSNFNTINANDMRDMFYQCSSLKSLDISKFIIKKDALYENIFDYTSPSLEIKTNNNFILSIFKNRVKINEGFFEKIRNLF